MRGLRSQLARVLNTEQAVGGTFTAISQVGLSFVAHGQLEFNETEFDTRDQHRFGQRRAAVQGRRRARSACSTRCSRRSSRTPRARACVPTAQTRLDEQLTKIADRIDEFERRLAIRREALQKEFTAADLAISQLKNSSGQLSSLSASQSAF